MNPKVTVEILDTHIEVEYIQGTDDKANELAKTITETLKVLLEKATGSKAERYSEDKVIH